VGPGHPGAEQPRTERLVGAAQLGPLQLDRAHRRLYRHRRLVAVAAARPVGAAATLVPGPAQELLDLGLQGGREHQPHAEPGNLFKDRRKVTVGAEQLVDLGAQALDRRYSSCHGCRSSLVLGGSREPTPVAHSHQGPDATCAERWIRTLKEQCLWAELHDNVDERRQAVAGFVQSYNTQWLIGRHGHRTPKEAYQDATTTAAA
jgi:hypothetical protein